LDILPALHASRIIITEYGRKFDFIEMRWALGSIKKRILWDYRIGKELVSWRPKFQNELIYTKNGPNQIIKHPYRVAISPDGNLLAEGGAGEIMLKKIDF